MYPWNHASQIAIDLGQAIAVFARASWNSIADCKGRKRRYLARKGLQLVASYQRQRMLCAVRSHDRVFIDVHSGDFLIVSTSRSLAETMRERFRRRDFYIYRSPRG